MYPAGELTLLLARKAKVRRRIARQRAQCVEAAAEIARPLSMVDRALETWKKIQPWMKIAAVPAGILAARTLGRRFRRLRSLIRWVPLLLSVLRGFSRGRFGYAGVVAGSVK